jgi:Zinc binding domain
MNCCAESDTLPDESPQAGLKRGCLSCNGPSRPVTLRTMLLMLRPELFGQIGESQYRFCASPDCQVVYFSRECSFTTGDLRVRVGLKEKDGPIPLCYCFGFSEEAAREEIRGKGHSTIPQHITALVKERMCACEERNPSGACCLGEVTQVVERLMKEATWRETALSFSAD